MCRSTTAYNNLDPTAKASVDAAKGIWGKCPMVQVAALLVEAHSQVRGRQGEQSAQVRSAFHSLCMASVLPVVASRVLMVFEASLESVVYNELGPMVMRAL